MQTFFSRTALIVVTFTLAACASAAPDEREPGDDDTDPSEVQVNDPVVAPNDLEIPPKKQKNPG